MLGASFIGPSLVLVAQRRDAFEQLAQWSESGGAFTRTVAAGDVSGRYIDIAVNRHGVQALVRFQDDPLRISTEIRGLRGIRATWAMEPGADT